MSVSLCSFNVRGLLNKMKRSQMFNWLKTEAYDICLLQETHLLNCKIDDIKQEWGGNVFLNGVNSNKEGTCILINSKLNLEIVKHVIICNGRVHALDIIINEKEITIINIYGPNTDNTAFFQDLEDYILSNDDKSFIIAGDFNTVLNIDFDKRNGRQDTHKNSRIKFNSIIDTNNLVDVWRLLILTKHSLLGIPIPSL